MFYSHPYTSLPLDRIQNHLNQVYVLNLFFEQLFLYLHLIYAYVPRVVSSLHVFHFVCIAQLFLQAAWLVCVP